MQELTHEAWLRRHARWQDEWDETVWLLHELGALRVASPSGRVLIDPGKVPPSSRALLGDYSRLALYGIRHGLLDEWQEIPPAPPPPDCRVTRIRKRGGRRRGWGVVTGGRVTARFYGPFARRRATGEYARLRPAERAS